MRQQGFGITHRLGGGIAQIVGTITIHTYHAHQRPKSRLMETIGKNTGRVAVNGSKNDRAHRTETNHILHKSTIHLTGIAGIGKTCFLRKSIGIEPRQQFEVHRQPHIAILGGMDVHIVHSRDKQTIPEINDRDTCIPLRHGGINPLDKTAVINRNIAVVDYLKGLRRRGIKDICLVDLHIQPFFSDFFLP